MTITSLIEGPDLGVNSRVCPGVNGGNRWAGREGLSGWVKDRGGGRGEGGGGLSGREVSRGQGASYRSFILKEFPLNLLIFAKSLKIPLSFFILMKNSLKFLYIFFGRAV